MIGHLPSGTKGFDANVVLTTSTARAFYAAGYRFAVRYVPRVKRHVNDLTRVELATILRAGLSAMIAQHVALPGWHPDEALGRAYGQVAALEADSCGYSFGATLWCDLEEVAKETTRQQGIDYANAWFEAVQDAGYQPGLYVGYGAGLGAQDLFHALKFERYWAALNLDRDKYPAVRGACMRQHGATSADRVPGVTFEFDVNLIGKDARGGAPRLMLAPGDR
jgi:hypothetical protein